MRICFVVGCCSGVVGLLVPFAAWAGLTWEIAGQSVTTFEDAEVSASTRIAQLNLRLKEIVPELPPRAAWGVDLDPVYVTRREKDAKGKETKVRKVQSIVLRLAGRSLLEISEADVRAHNASSLESLANTWAAALQNVVQKAEVRQFLSISIVAPEKLVYNGNTYRLQPEMAPDRGLFRTTGKQVAGKVVFWEVPANDRTYQLDSKTTQEWEKISLNPDRIFIFDRNWQFIPYLLQR